jgi:hypothetical protein
MLPSARTSASGLIPATLPIRSDAGIVRIELSRSSDRAIALDLHEGGLAPLAVSAGGASPPAVHASLDLLQDAVGEPSPYEPGARTGRGLVTPLSAGAAVHGATWSTRASSRASARSTHRAPCCRRAVQRDRVVGGGQPVVPARVNGLESSASRSHM